MIVGGGPAGAAAAIDLATAGREVTLIERNAIPMDKVCGDFLSAEAVGETLVHLGVDLSAATEITSVRLIQGRRAATTHLPFVGRGLSRRALDEALLRQAQRRGAVVLRGRHVRSVRDRSAGLELDCGASDCTVADTLFLATGKHDVRGVGRPERGIGLVGFKTYYELAPAQRAALRGHIELILFEGGYAGLQQVEADQVVLCMSLPAARLRAVGGKWPNLIDDLMNECPHLRERLTAARTLRDRPSAIAGLPYGYLHVPQGGDLPGLFRLGDQAAVIGSLTGDGVALALASGGLAARTWLAGGDAETYHRRLAAGLSRQLRFASIIHRLCVTPALQPSIRAVCGLWPGAMRWAASLTRTQAL